MKDRDKDNDYANVRALLTDCILMDFDGYCEIVEDYPSEEFCKVCEHCI